MASKIPIQPAYSYAGIVDRIVDGDTVDVVIALGFYTYIRQRVRLVGVDTPERGEQGWAEASAGLAAIIPPHTEVTLQAFKPDDKYGRFLARITRASDGLDVSREMLDLGFGVPYDGGARQ